MNPNYDEKPLAVTPSYEGFNLIVEPPLPATGAKRKVDGGRRSASWRRKQLVALMVDESGSMRRHKKAEYATEAAHETVYQCRGKCHASSAFDMAIFGYGDFIFAKDQHLLRPVNEINVDEILFEGKGGQTKIKQAMKFMSLLLDVYDEGYLKPHPEPERVPEPLIFLLSDGFNGDGDPVPLAKQLRTTPRSTGVPPTIVTVGIEKGTSGKDKPNVEMLEAIASRNKQGEPLYFDVRDLNLLIELISTTSSSSASSPDDIFNQAILLNPEWSRRAGRLGK